MKTQTIPDTAIRNEQVTSALYYFEKTMEEIPMTTAQRDEIVRLVYQINAAFREANHVAKQYEKLSCD